MNAKLIKVVIEVPSQGGEGAMWHAVSPDLPTFLASEPSRAALFAAIPRVLEMMYEGWVAHQVEWKANDDLYWVVVPTRK